MTRSLTSPSGRWTLRELILRGELPAGARLGEVELAERLGVSRTPVREALTRLAAEGLVEIVANRGARVATWTVAELEGVFDLRASLEPQLTGFAVPHATADDVAALDDLAHRHARGRPSRPAAGPRRARPAEPGLPRPAVALADHPTLATALAAAIHPPIVRRNFHAYDEASLRRSLGHHLEIVAAVRAGDPAWAQAVMTAHIPNARAVMVRGARQDTHTSDEEAS